MHRSSALDVNRQFFDRLCWCVSPVLFLVANQIFRPLSRSRFVSRAFMSKFHVKLSARAKEGAGNNVAMFDAMYADREKLETIFRFFDTDGNGSISREEFHKVGAGVGVGHHLGCRRPCRVSCGFVAHGTRSLL